MQKLVVRGVPVLLLSLLLVGVGGGVCVAGEDPAARLLQLRLETEQAIGRLRDAGQRELADEMSRQLPGTLAQVVDRVSFALPDPAHFDHPAAAQILGSQQEERQLHQQLASLAHFTPPAAHDSSSATKDTKDTDEELAFRDLKDTQNRNALDRMDRRAHVLAARVRFADGLIQVTSATVTNHAGVTINPTTVVVTPGSGATVTPGGGASASAPGQSGGTPASPPGGGSTPGNSGNNGHGH